MRARAVPLSYHFLGVSPKPRRCGCMCAPEFVYSLTSDCAKMGARVRACRPAPSLRMHVRGGFCMLANKPLSNGRSPFRACRPAPSLQMEVRGGFCMLADGRLCKDGSARSGVSPIPRRCGCMCTAGFACSLTGLCPAAAVLFGRVAQARRCGCMCASEFVCSLTGLCPAAAVLFRRVAHATSLCTF